jgi:hypothetical protein
MIAKIVIGILLILIGISRIIYRIMNPIKKTKPVKGDVEYLDFIVWTIFIVIGLSLIL